MEPVSLNNAFDKVLLSQNGVHSYLVKGKNNQVEVCAPTTFFRPSNRLSLSEIHRITQEAINSTQDPSLGEELITKFQTIKNRSYRKLTLLDQRLHFWKKVKNILLYAFPLAYFVLGFFLKRQVQHFRQNKAKLENLQLKHVKVNHLPDEIIQRILFYMFENLVALSQHRTINADQFRPMQVRVQRLLMGSKQLRFHVNEAKVTLINQTNFPLQSVFQFGNSSQLADISFRHKLTNVNFSGLELCNPSDIDEMTSYLSNIQQMIIPQKLLTSAMVPKISHLKDLTILKVSFLNKKIRKLKLDHLTSLSFTEPDTFVDSEMFRNFSQLKALHIEHPGNCIVFHKEIREGAPQLEFLSLKFLFLDHHIQKMFNQMSCLKTVIVDNGRIIINSRLLWNQLERLTNLTRLELTTAVERDNHEPIGKFLKNKPELESIKLDLNYLYDENVEDLHECPKLKSLEVQAKFLGLPGIISISKIKTLEICHIHNLDLAFLKEEQVTQILLENPNIRIITINEKQVYCSS